MSAERTELRPFQLSDANEMLSVYGDGDVRFPQYPYSDCVG